MSYVLKSAAAYDSKVHTVYGNFGQSSHIFPCHSYPARRINLDFLYETCYKTVRCMQCIVSKETVVVPMLSCVAVTMLREQYFCCCIVSLWLLWSCVIGVQLYCCGDLWCSFTVLLFSCINLLLQQIAVHCTAYLLNKQFTACTFISVLH